MNSYQNDKELIEDLKSEHHQAFIEVYQRYFKMAFNHVTANHGSAADAEDVFQEALLVLVMNLRKPEFSIHTSLGAFLFTVVRQHWLWKLRGKKDHAPVNPEDFKTETGEWEDIGQFEKNFEQRHVIVHEAMLAIGEDCRKVIHLFYNLKKSLSEIALEMGYTGDFIKVKKHRCINALKKIAAEHPDYLKIQNG